MNLRPAIFSLFFLPLVAALAQERLPDPCFFPYSTRNLTDRNLEKCSELNQFLKRHQDKEISIVFSGQFLKAPSSAFGHTLLKFSAPNEDNDLLAQAINFAANPDTSNPFLYALKGLFGGFNGVFQSMPYHYKIREYSDSESRDLWSYPLRLSSDQKKILLYAIFEQAQKPIPYYYSTQNCASVLIETINKVINKKIKENFISTPLQTIINLNDHPELISSPKFRASLKKQVVAEYQDLSDNSKIEFQKLKDEKFSNDFRAIDTWLDYEKVKNFQKINAESSPFRSKILNIRSQIQDKKEQSNVPSPFPPHLSHKQSRISFGQHFSTNSQRIAFRLAGHDDRDPQISFEDQLQISLLDFEFSHNQKSSKLDRFTLVSTQATPTFEAPFYSPSWGLSFGINRTKENLEKALYFSGNWGISPKFKNFIFRSSINSEFFYQGSLFPRIGPKFAIQITHRFFNIHPEFEYLYNIQSKHWEPLSSITIKGHLRQFGLGTKVSYFNNSTETFLFLDAYF